MSDDTNDWRELREFAGVRLDESFVLSWALVGDSLCIDLDLCLAPEHSFYEEPRPSEGKCIRAAILEFPFCSLVADAERSAGSADMDSAAIAAAASGLGLGKVDGMRRIGDGQYEISGSFGRVRIDAERPLVRLKDA